MSRDISQTGLQLEDWVEIRRNDPRPLDGHTIDGFYSLSHEHKTIPDLVMARFFLQEQELWRAWGWQQEEHCSFHLVLLEEKPLPHAGCPPVSVQKQNEQTHIEIATTPTISIPVAII